jgi:O-antigen/teichoic acid export membrane protein
VIFLDEDPGNKPFIKKIKGKLSAGGDISTIGLTDIINNAIGYGFWLYIASIISVKDYGQVNYLVALGGIVSSLCLIGSYNSMVVLLAKDIKIHTSLISLSLIIGICSSIAFSIITESVELGFLIIGYVVMNLSISEIIGKKKFYSYFRYTILVKASFVILSIALFQVMGLKGIIIGIALSSLIFSFRIVRILITEKIDFKILWQERKFILTNFFTSSFDAAAGNLDKIIILPILGFISLGNYQFGLQIAGLLMLIPSIAFKYTLPNDSQGVSNKKIKQVIICIVVLLTITFILIAPILIQAIIPKYVHAIPIVQIAALSAIPNTINYMILSSYLGKQKNRVTIMHSIIYASTLITFVISLGSLFADIGLAIAFTLAHCSVSTYYITIYLRSKRSITK